MSKVTIKEHVSLIDLSKQMPFEIDQAVKKEICFGETLIVSCGHYEGEFDEEEEESESEWSCEDSTETTVSEEVKVEQGFEIKDFIPEEPKPAEDEEEENDFHFYFFPDCNKPPPPQNSKTSVIEVDGVPKINPIAQRHIYCTCKKDKTGQCPCFMKLPCQCGAKIKATCTCSELKDICVCYPGYPQTVCKCKSSNVCVCDPDGKIFPECTCGKIDKPCVCHPKKFPSPVCKCKYKPKLFSDLKNKYKAVIEEGFEGEGEAISETEGEHKAVKAEAEPEEPCTCQEPEPKKICQCLKGESCTCVMACICGVQRPCICDPKEFKELPCKKDEIKTVCTCAAPKVCTCSKETEGGICSCFPVKICTCNNPEKCKCFTTCDCTNPCICDTSPVKVDECVCLYTPKKTSDIKCTCACREDPTKKIKKVRAGKEGYRWCREVDPRHTYFDYAYGRHDKILNKETEFAKKFKIESMDASQYRSIECPIHRTKHPSFQKKPRKPSLDCCSAVGGISICVETLGDNKDKFLVQIVSYSSKEGAKTGSKLISILDCNLHTLEENRIEHITKNITKERRNYMAICDSGYYNKVTRICGEKHVVKRFYHPFEKAHSFVLEGANIVLMRYMAVRRHKGVVKTSTVMMDGTICESVYVCLGTSQGIVNGKPLYVVKIERHIIEPSGLIHQTLTVLSLRGYTISHEWADNCYMLHINPLLQVIPERDEIEPHAQLRDEWRKDLQLMSDFLDFKATRVSEGGRYITESGTLTGTVRDYLQAILMLRPQDTLPFTRHYFGTVLSALDLPHDEYFDPASKHVRYYYFEE